MLLSLVLGNLDYIEVYKTVSKIRDTVVSIVKSSIFITQRLAETFLMKSLLCRATWHYFVFHFCFISNVMREISVIQFTTGAEQRLSTCGIVTPGGTSSRFKGYFYIDL